MKGNTKPNILYVMNDQQKASAASVYGNPHVPSPFMDAMAAEGITFLNAYSASPICTPSRATVFTGVHPLVHQVTCHQNRAPINLPQLSELLLQDGYFTAVAGHYEEDRGLTRGWVEQARHHEAGVMLQSYQKWAASGRRDVSWSSGTLEYPADRGNAHYLTTRAVHMLDQIQAAQAPFFLHVAYLEPHVPYFAPPPYDTLVDRSKLDLPQRGNDAGRPAWQFKALEQNGTALATEVDIRQAMAIYYGMIAYADDEMRRLYQEMDRRGMLENTWIVLASDHGDYLGEKGLFAKSESLYECLLHVPLIIVPPRGMRAPRGLRVSGLVDLADLFPTILSIAETSVPTYVQGQDLVAWANTGAGTPLRGCVFGQVGNYQGRHKTTWPTGMPEAGRRRSLVQGGRTQEFSYMRDPDNGDEAYDLRHDPKELDNLFNHQGAAEPPQITALRRRVDAWEEECVRLRQELGIVPGYRGFDLE